MTKRKHLTRLVRERIYLDADKACCICGDQIDAQHEKWIVEHVKPLWLGGADDASNMRPAHYRCAIEKTRAEAPVKAKTDRQRTKIKLNIRAPSRWAKRPRTKAKPQRSASRPLTKQVSVRGATS